MCLTQSEGNSMNKLPKPAVSNTSLSFHTSSVQNTIFFRYFKAGLTDNHSLSTKTNNFQAEYYSYSQLGSYNYASLYTLTITESLYYTFALYLSFCPFISVKSDVPSSQNVPNNNFYHSQTSSNINKNSLKNKITKYCKRCRRTMRSAFLRLRRWMSEHHRVLVWHCYCIFHYACIRIYR